MRTREDRIADAWATIVLAIDELVLLNNVLKEVCDSVRELADDAEFRARLGASREDAQGLMAEIETVVDWLQSQ